MISRKKQPYKDIFLFVLVKVFLLCGLSFALTFFPKPRIKLTDLNSFSFQIESQN